MFQMDTIAAVATALSDAGIGIVRISGPQAVSVVDPIFCTKSGKHILREVESHTVHYGFIIEKDSVNWQEHVIDEVMVSYYRGPKSFTAEDTVEINCHGGVLVVKRVLEEVLKNGSRLAEPGEFSKRAFLNGRIDLSKAEAVMDIIHSENEFALKSSIRQLRGDLSGKIRELREKLIYEIAFIESALDDPEHISLEEYPKRLFSVVDSVEKQILRMIETADNGKLMKEGINTVILGKPNAGKSTLLNLLVGQEKAIVTEIAGTTRDVITETVHLNGITLNVIDTAGIRNTDDIVEKIGVERARKEALEADLILYVADASVEPDESDREILSIIRDKKVIILLNKNDLETVTDEKLLKSLIESMGISADKISMISTSTKNFVGIDILEEKISDMFFKGMIQSNQEIVITNMRHKEALIHAFDSLELVKKSIEDNMPEDFYSIDLMSAYKSLGLIIGEEIEDDLVEEIFSKFCMGK